MEQAFELTPAQKGIADLKYFYAGTSITTLCGAVLFDERFDGQVLQDAVREVFSRHEALSLRFASVNGKIMQSVADFEDEPVEPGFIVHGTVWLNGELRKACEEESGETG